MLNEGVYLMEVKSLVVGENKNGLLTAVAEYACEEGSITAYHNLVKTNKEINEHGYKSLQKAFGITAKDPWDLEAAVGCTVKVTLKYEFDQENRPILQVKWVNHPDDQGGIRKTSDDDKKLFKAQYGAFFRALAETDVKAPVRAAQTASAPAPGRTYAPAPGQTAKPNGAPPAPTATAPAPPVAPPVDEEGLPHNAQEAWVQFNQAYSGNPQDVITGMWFEALNSVFGTTQAPATATPQQWKKVVFYEAAEKEEVPF